MSKKEIPYLELSGKKRGNLFIYHKNKIRAERIKIGRNFTTHDYIGEDARCSWADFVFISNIKKKIYYNAYICTAQDAMVEKASNTIMEQLIPLFSKYIGFELKTEVVKRDAYGKPLLYKWDTSDHNKTHEELDGKTFFQYQDDKIDEYLQQNKPPVFEEYKLCYDYVSGIGLEMVVDEEIITEDVIEKHIQMFYDLGEKDWISKSPVPEEKLVYSHDWRKIKNISFSNALVGISFDENGNKK